MRIIPGRMVHLGYAKYWRSDEILGLLPIEEDRGPGRRTHVYVSSRSEPVVASRTEETLLEEMVGEEGSDAADVQELRAAARELAAGLRGLSPMLKRMLKNEEGLDVQAWIRRLEGLAGPGGSEAQEDLFPGA